MKYISKILATPFLLITQCTSFSPVTHRPATLHPITTSTTQLHSLKPAALPLMDSGKALARSGELLIDATSTPKLDNYGGGLSSAGASIRNAGDCIAQAAASCRFKTASELVSDEIREAATCLIEAVVHLKKAADDAQVDELLELKGCIVNNMMPHMVTSGKSLEMAGAGIMKREKLVDIGQHLVDAAGDLELLALGIQKIDGELEETKVSGQRMMYASEKMKEAGNNLMGIMPEVKKGKSWLKG
jgi:hypothetical protein